MNIKIFKTIIKESIHDYIKEIDEAGDTAAMDAKIAKCEEAIALREKKIEMSESLEEMKDMVDPGKINELKKEIKDLQKAKAKFEKIKDKKANKGKKKEIVTDSENTEEASDMEATITDEALDSSNESLNESFTRMQKLAGIITESEYKEKKSYKQKINEVFPSNVWDWDIKEFGEFEPLSNTFIEYMDDDAFADYMDTEFPGWLDDGDITSEGTKKYREDLTKAAREEYGPNVKVKFNI
jgi:hypothetical protein